MDNNLVNLSTATADPQTMQSTLRFSRRPEVSQRVEVLVANDIAGAPTLAQGPSGPGQILTDVAGVVWYTPTAILPKMSDTSDTPNVFFDDPNGVWQLRVAIDFLPPAGIPETAAPMPMDGITIRLLSTTASLTFSDQVDAPPTAPAVRRIVATATLPDKNAVVTALAEVNTTTLTVEGTVHWKPPPPPPPPPPPTDQSPPIFRVPIDRVPLERVFERRPPIFINPRNVQQPFMAERPAAAQFVAADQVDLSLRRMRLIDRVRLEPPPIFVPPTDAPAPVATPMRLTEGAAIPAFFPASTPSYKRIYARVKPGSASDPNGVWVQQSSSMWWRDAVVPNEFFVTPQEYRIALDPDTGLPAMSVFLVSSPDPDGKSQYRVRVRFVVAPWIDPVKAASTRAVIESSAQVIYPRLVVGGADSAKFTASGLLNSLGAVLQPSGGATADSGLTAAVDPAGFELVFDCTLEFYALLGNLMTGKGGQVPGVEGQVQLAVRTGDQPADAKTMSVPVHLRLDRLAGQILTVTPGSTPAADATSIDVAVTNNTAFGVTVGSMLGALLTTVGEPPLPWNAAAALCAPSTLTLAAKGAAAPTAIALTTTAPDLLLADVDAAEVEFVDLAVQVDPPKVLAQIHELASSGSITTSVKVRSYLLAHPDQLPPGFTDVFGLEVQVERGAATPFTVVITRDEPEKTTDVAFSFNDLIAGIRPDTPELKVRRRNMIPTGTSAWSDWETFVGRELFISPVLPAPVPVAPTT